MPSFLDPTPAAKPPKYKAPAGYRMADDVNYPQSPSAVGGIVDEMGLPTGRGSNMMGDPYSDQEVDDASNLMKFDFNQKPNQPSAAGSESFGAAQKDAATRQAQNSVQPTVIHSGEAARLGIGSQDEALLDGLGPEYAAEGQRLLGLKAAKRQPITGRNETTGESFVMPVGNRVSRQTLQPAMERIQSEIAARKLQEQQGKQFGQEQALARIPGENAVGLAKVKGDYGMRSQESEQIFKKPEQMARVGQMQQQTQAGAGQERRTDQQFQQADNPDARRRLANDAAIKALQEAGAANSPAGQAILAQLQQEGSVGSQLGGNAPAYAKAASAPNESDQFDSYSALLNDPQITKAIDAVKANKQGWFSSHARTEKQGAAITGLKTYVQKYAKAKGLDFNEVWPQIAQQVNAERR